MDFSDRTPPAPLLDTGQVAAIIGCTPTWLVKLRAQNAGPPFIRIGSLVRYRIEDLEGWLDRNCVMTDNGEPAVPVPPAERCDIASRVAPDTAAA